LSGTEPHSEVALLYSYDSRWAINWQRHNQAFDPKEALISYYGPLRSLVHSVDIVSASASLGQYKLVVAPALNVLTDAQANNLMEYVRAGGHLVLGQRSAMKNDDSGLQPERQPGPFTALLGGRVEQFYALDQDVPVTGDWGSGSGKIWAEQLSVKDPQAHVLMRYGKSNGWLDGQPAAITKTVGKGSITYIGAWLDEKTMDAAAKWMVETSGIHPLNISLPKGVDLYVRSKNGQGGDQKTVWILINFGKDAATVALPGQMADVLGGGRVGSVKLEPYGVSVLSKE
jgi:beta-galactosidase